LLSMDDLKQALKVELPLLLLFLAALHNLSVR
jgi:hypothetical protein